MNHLILSKCLKLRQLITCPSSQIFKRTVYSDSSAYAGDGKTTVRVLNDDGDNLNLINTYSANGFRLNNNLYIQGSLLVFPTYIFSWNVKRGIDITPESLLVLDIVVPKAKIVVIGYGARDEPHDETLRLHFKKRGISCELLPTENAITTFNYLVCDSVHAVGAFIPPYDQMVETGKDKVLIRSWNPVKDPEYERERVERANVLFHQHVKYHDLNKEYQEKMDSKKSRKPREED